jgi:glutamate-ammonia-ligase adenylyltransferase
MSSTPDADLPALSDADVNPLATSPEAGGAAYSRCVQRLRRRYADQLHLLSAGAPQRPAMEAALRALQAQGLETGAALRVLRQMVMERLVVLDCEGDGPTQAPLAVVTRAMTDLAELALDVAMAATQKELDALYGAPLATDAMTDSGSDKSTPQPSVRASLWVIGMGKLGARELNVSSDIDLIYVYDQDGQTAGRADGRGSISNHEYFAHQVKAMYALIGDTTEHGFVFRVDLALRPNGNSGPAAVSLNALEEYFQVQGREWERFAWLKSRVVAPLSSLSGGVTGNSHETGSNFSNSSAQALRGSVLPFVFRRYLDYNVFDALRTLHRQIREQAQRRCAGHPERANDVKLSRGGIREIEFTVQLLQVVRGGQFPELRTRPTLDALQRVANAGLMPQETADALARAYVFLRRVEHRIQYLDDQQTHVLPTRDDDLAWIAQTLGYRDCCAFLSELDTHRELVAGEFDKLLGGNAECKGCNKVASAPQELSELVDQQANGWPERFRTRIAEWSSHPRVLALREESRGRLIRLVQRTAVLLSEGKVTEEAALRLVDWIEPLLRRESYLAMLLECPSVHERLLRLLGAAKWTARYLQQHPGVIDELASDDMLHQRFEPAAFKAEVELRLAALKRTGEDDDEACLNLLRRAHHAETFRTLARDLEDMLSVEEVADDLSALAEAVLSLTADWCWQRLKFRHREQSQFAVIAYGKLGGKELGYGSDLDIVFVYQDDHEQAAEVYAMLVRKIINWLTIKTAEGDLFEIDTALRPNGGSGLLVISFAAYSNYQQQRGSNTAWTWEHQAMTRARCVLGDASLHQRFDEVRHAVISAPRNVAALRAEIMAMRDKVRLAHLPKRKPAGLASSLRGAAPVTEKFDVKHAVGGMVDAEFAVQFLVLAESDRHPELADNVGNIALLQRAERAGLLPPGVGYHAADAYRTLRRVQHQARLNEESTQVSLASVQTERAAIQALWAAVFG